MTNEEALNNLKQKLLNTDMPNTIRVAISAIEKQIPKKPLIRYENMGFGNFPNETIKVQICPCCKEDLCDEPSYCLDCGQRIDWTEGEEE